MLPFESPIATPPLTIQGATIPVYGSLTVNELLMLDSISCELLADTGEFNSTAGALLLDWHIKTVLATMLIVSRSDATWTLERSHQLPSADLDAVVELFFRERDRPDKKPASASKKGNNDPINWADLYCRLRLLYPTEEQLNRENFGNCPIALIEQYLDTAKEVEIERLSNEAQATANLGVWVAAANGAKKTPETRWFNVFEAVQFTREAIKKFPPELAQSFVQLHKNGKIPFWLEDHVDMDVIKASAGTIADAEEA